MENFGWLRRDPVVSVLEWKFSLFRKIALRPERPAYFQKSRLSGNFSGLYSE